ncbi:OB-fold domain-containing protein [Ancylobacter sp. A5.8]|uniref:Zn-ribbon domain-containing OB-fold protein n=1 Tax=Ancylobacter gelatini TaxID=2919920 RepID=UPI001F4E6262|nr:OB-fold domain-containing protein [Ancylobacter gelatini]MCJ8144006.1 OB-fold domain-containing protein [Ancylobacter gelatini]
MNSPPQTRSMWLPGGAASVDAQGRPVLVGGECRACHTRMFPKTTVCCACMSEDVADAPLPSEGTLYSFTQVHVGPAQWNKPLVVGYVDLPDGVRLFSHLRNSAALAIGGPVHLTLGQVGTSAEGEAITTFMFAAGEQPQ